MKLTRKQIIDDTAAAYTSRNRAVGSNGGCFYKLRNCMCAVGRYCVDPSEDWAGSWGNVQFDDGSELRKLSVEHYDELLRPEVRGQPNQFWLDLQSLHDTRENWNADGLSYTGKMVVDSLHKKWDEHNEPA